MRSSWKLGYLGSEKLSTIGFMHFFSIKNLYGYLFKRLIKNFITVAC